MKNKIFKAISIMLSIAIVLSVCTMAFTTTVVAVSPTYYIDDVNGNDTNAGGEDAPLQSIKGAIDKANAAGCGEGDVVTVHIKRNSAVPKFEIGGTEPISLPEHNFTLKLTSVPGASGTSKQGLLGNQNVILGGPVIFENVRFSSSSAKNIYTNGNDIDFCGNITTNNYTRICIGSTSTTEFTDDINVSFKNLESAISSFYFCLGNEKQARTFSGDINIDYDSPLVDGNLYLGGADNSTNYTTTYAGNININLKASKSKFTLNRRSTKAAVAFADGAAVQIKNSSGNPISYGANLPEATITDANYYYLTLASADEEKLQFTDTAGKFAITEGYIASAQPTDAGGVALDKAPTVSENGYLTLDTKGYYTVTFTEAPKEPKDFLFYVSATGDDDNSGLDADNALATIEAAINKVVTEGYDIEEQVVTIYVKRGDGTAAHFGASTGTVTLPEHKFTVKVLTDPDDTTKANVGAQNVILSGPMIFENINIYASSASNVYLNGNKVDFLENATSSNYMRFAIGNSSTTTEFTDDINVSFKDVGSISNFCLGNEKASRTFSGDINLVYDSLNADGIIYPGVSQNYGNITTTYNGNVNLNIKSTKTKFTLNRRSSTAGIAFADDTAFQIINSSGKPLEYGSNMSDDVIAAAGKYFIITNDSGFKEAIQFTDTAGKFAVNTELYNVKAYLLDENGNRTGNAIQVQDGFLTLTTSGKYSVDVEKLALSETYYVSSTVMSSGDGLTEQTAVKTVGEAVAKAVESNYGIGDYITIKVMGETAEIGVIPQYDFALNIQSNIANEKSVLTFTEGTADDGVYNLANGGDTTYSNVIISLKEEYKYAFLQWSNVTFESDVVFDFHMYAGIAYGTNRTSGANNFSGQKVVIKSNIPPYIKMANTLNGQVTYDDDVTLVLEGDGKPEVYMNSYFNNKPNGYTTYSKNFNILDNQAYIVLLRDLERVTINGKLQVINGTTSDYVANLRHVNAEKIIINNKTGNKQLLDFTETAGKFSVNSENILYVFKDGVQVTTSKDGYIDVTAFGDGEYDVVDSREKTYNATTTVAAAVQQAINDGYTTRDIITINVDGETINLGTLPEYDFDLVVKSDDKATVIVDDTALLANGGKVTYKNVVIKYTGNDSVNLADQDAKFDKDVVFDIGGKIYLGESEADVDGRKVEFLSFVDEIVLSNGANKTYKGDLNITLNSDDATTIYFGDEAGTTYEKNVNMYVEKAQSINFVNNATFGGALQIINSSENNINASTSGISGVNAYIITDETGIYKAIECTDVAGKYKLNFDTALYNITVKKNNIDVVENAVSGKYITLTEAGEYTVTVELKGTYSSYIYERTSNNGNVSLQNFAAKINRGEEVNVVYMGGSVTNGSGATEREANSWRAIVGKWLVENFPNAKINNINRAIGATGSLLGSYRLEHDIIAEKPDLFIIEFSINDWLGKFTYEDARRQFETIVRNTRLALPECDIITVYTTDKRLVSESRKQSDGTAGVIHEQARAHDEIAEKYGMPAIHIGRALLDTLPDNFTQADWDYYFMDTVHPNDNGYVVYAEVVKEFLAGCLFTQPKEVKKHVLPRMVSDTLLDGNIEFISADEEFVSNLEDGSGEFAVKYIKRFENVIPIIELTTESGPVKFKFTGTELSVYEFNASGYKYNVSIDGNEPYMIEYTNTPEYPIFLAKDLPYGEHTIEISAVQGVGLDGKYSQMYFFFARDSRAETVEVNGDINLDNELDIRDLVTADLVQKDSFDDIYGLGMADKNMDGVVDDKDIEILRLELLTGEEYVPQTNAVNDSPEVTPLSVEIASDEKQFLMLKSDRKHEEIIV